MKEYIVMMLAVISVGAGLLALSPNHELFVLMFINLLFVMITLQSIFGKFTTIDKDINKIKQEINFQKELLNIKMSIRHLEDRIDKL